MAQNYILCSGGTPLNYSVDIQDQVGCSCQTPGCFDYTTQWNGGIDTTFHWHKYDLTTDAPVDSNLTVDYKMTYTINGYVGYALNFTQTYYVYASHIFYFGDQLHVIEYPNIDAIPCYKTVGYVSGGGTYTEHILIAIAVQPQAVIPECIPSPPGCTLAIGGATPTDPSQRGAADGTITANITVDGSPDWYLNGTIDAGNLSGHTFTGLVSGTYIIRAMSGSCWDEISAFVGEGEFVSGDFVVVDPTANGNIVATENPILLTLNTALNSTSPDYSVNTFTVTGSISNVIIDFNLTFPYNYQAEFRSKGYPDRASYFLESILKNQVGATVGNNTADEISTSIGEAFQKDAILNRIYYITTSGSVITLIAKEFGAGYDLNSSNVSITGSNLVLANITSGMAEFDGGLTPDYSLYTELFVNNIVEYGETPVLNDFRRVQELELPFSQDNQHQFNVAPTLKNFVSSPKIPFTITGVTYLGSMIASYFCKYGEKYPLVTGSNTKKKRYKGQTSYGYCINSALNFEDSNSMNQYFGTSNVYFLNTASNTKYSQRDAKEFLNFTITQDYQYPLAVFGNIYLYDGSLYSNVKLLDITTSGATFNFGGVAVVSVGYNDLGLVSYESSSKIRKVELQIMQNTGSWVGYSEIKSYMLEIDEQPSRYNVAFLNKLGTYETFSFIGELQETEDINRNLYQRPYSLNASGAAAIGFEYNSTINTEFTKTFTVNTGIIDADTYYFIMGMLQSNKIFHYSDIHQTYLNVVGQTAMKSTNTNEYSIQIQFKETISENNVNS